MIKNKGVHFGLQYLEEGEYDVRAGRGNQVVAEMKVVDGLLYMKNKDEWVTKVQPSWNEYINNMTI